jgi:hypothetical protein
MVYVQYGFILIYISSSNNGREHALIFTNQNFNSVAAFIEFFVDFIVITITVVFSVYSTNKTDMI